MKELYVGAITGTSMNGIDAVLINFSRGAKILATHTESIPKPLLNTLQKLCFPGNNEIDLMGQADVELGLLFAKTVNRLIKKTNIKPKQIKAIGSHGQNIRHRPDLRPPFTLQIGDPNTIAVHTNIVTVGDFRRKDMALGGEGAPLAPGFHQTFMRAKNKNRVIVNIGGIANITLLPSKGKILGFDTGPGNTLLDAWSQQEQGKAYDKSGKWAKSGKINQTLLDTLLQDPYFKKKSPKSTGREYFNLGWLSNIAYHDKPENIQRTLLELTAQTIVDAIHRYKNIDEIIVCGGGAYNTFLMQRLSDLAKPKVMTSDLIGISPEWIEACAFAWFAKQTLEHKHSNLPDVTGAKRPAILGGIYYP